MGTFLADLPERIARAADWKPAVRFPAGVPA
jgi:hypothetical protein